MNQKQVKNLFKGSEKKSINKKENLTDPTTNKLNIFMSYIKSSKK